MKTNMWFVTITLGLSIYCFGGNRVALEIKPQQSKIESKDTVIKVSEYFSVLYKRYDNDLKLWQYPNTLWRNMG
ncbi:MAG: hypothetical protein LUF01_12230 [Bacteroides sp.]|nr:hypothetical protein [Bacteroides sp.]